MAVARPAPKLGRHKTRIQDLVAENERLPRKQQYTWYQIYKIIEKEGYQGSESNLRHYLAAIFQYPDINMSGPLIIWPAR